MVDLADSAEPVAPAQHSSPQKDGAATSADSEIDPRPPKTPQALASGSPRAPPKSSTPNEADDETAAASAAADVLSALQEKQVSAPSVTANTPSVPDNRVSATRDPGTTSLVSKPDESSSSPQSSNSDSSGIAKTPNQSLPESPTKPGLVQKPPSPPTQPPSTAPSPRSAPSPSAGPDTKTEAAVATSEPAPASANGPANGPVLLSPPALVTPKKSTNDEVDINTPSKTTTTKTTTATINTGVHSEVKITPDTITVPGGPTLEEFNALQQQVRDLWQVVGALTAAVEHSAVSVLGRVKSNSTLQSILSRHATLSTPASTALSRAQGLSFAKSSKLGPRGTKRRSAHRDERPDSDDFDVEDDDDDSNQSNGYNEDNLNDENNSNYDFHHHHYHHHHHYNNDRYDTDEYYNDINRTSTEYRGSERSRQRVSLSKQDASAPNVSGASKPGGTSSNSSGSFYSSFAAGSSSAAAPAGKSVWREGGNNSSNTGSKKQPMQQQQQHQRLGFHAINTRPPPPPQQQTANTSHHETQHRHKKHRRSYSSDRSVSPAARRSDLRKGGTGGGSSSGRGGNTAITSNGDASHTALQQQASQRPLKKNVQQQLQQSTTSAQYPRYTDDDQAPSTIQSATPSVKNSPTSGSGAPTPHRSMVSAAPTASDLLEDDDDESTAAGALLRRGSAVGDDEGSAARSSGKPANEENGSSGAMILAQQPDPRRYYEGLSERASWMVKTITMEKRNMYGNLILFQDLSVAYLRHGTLINSRVAKQRISPFANDVDEKILSKFLDNLQRYRIYLRKIIEAKIEKISDNVYLTGCLEDVPMLETIYIPDDDEEDDDDGNDNKGRNGKSRAINEDSEGEEEELRPPKPDFDTKLITQGLTRQHLTRGNHLYCICNRVVGYCTSICPCYKANIGCTDKCEMVPEANDFCPSTLRRGKKTSVGHLHASANHTPAPSGGQKQAVAATHGRNRAGSGRTNAAAEENEETRITGGEEESSQ